MTSPNPNYLPKASLAKYHKSKTLEIKFQHEFQTEQVLLPMHISPDPPKLKSKRHSILKHQFSTPEPRIKWHETLSPPEEKNLQL